MPYRGRFDITTPNGHKESYQVKPKKGDYFKTEKEAENAARRMGHIKMQGSRKYPIGSVAHKYSEFVF